MNTKNDPKAERKGNRYIFSAIGGIVIILVCTGLYRLNSSYSHRCDGSIQAAINPFIDKEFEEFSRGGLNISGTPSSTQSPLEVSIDKNGAIPSIPHIIDLDVPRQTDFGLFDDGHASRQAAAETKAYSTLLDTVSHGKPTFISCYKGSGGTWFTLGEGIPKYHYFLLSYEIHLPGANKRYMLAEVTPSSDSKNMLIVHEQLVSNDRKTIQKQVDKEQL